jgi:myo-inositol 2-dehydrogenase / D-chiro-inositol 1-dehydrogenase
MEHQPKLSSRRHFMKDAASVAALGALGAGVLLKSCSSDRSTKVNEPQFLDQSPDGRILKAGVIGCGGRGTGAAINFLDAGPNLQITALADVFQDRLDRSRNQLRERKNVEVADEQCFVGFDAYQKLLETDVDLVLVATPPFFRPMHFDAAVRARKHVFLEKPVAVDPVGARAIMASARMADTAGLKVGAGTQRRHQRDYVTAYEHIKSGAIGDIVAANCYWNQSQLWSVAPQAGWTQMEMMLRDWVNWEWLSGDHIVEQHVHNIDVINWFTGLHPVKAVGFGARHRRPTGDQYDFFNVDFVYDNGMHLHSMCRQISGCTNNVSEWIVGTKGRSNCANMIEDLDGNKIWEYNYPLNEEGQPSPRAMKPAMEQEIIDLVAAIRNNTPFNKAEDCAISTLTAIMGRISAYTGKEVTWEEMINSNLRLGPSELAFGPVDIDITIPTPGA